jgi:hypothetical protein
VPILSTLLTDEPLPYPASFLDAPDHCHAIDDLSQLRDIDK